jgi:HPt (histidine-containing phosphotransfer) domain-containing protein
MELWIDDAQVASLSFFPPDKLHVLFEQSLSAAEVLVRVAGEGEAGFRQIQEHAHRVKGSAGTAGLAGLAHLAAELEAAAIAAVPDAELVARLADAILQTRAALRAKGLLLAP